MCNIRSFGEFFCKWAKKFGEPAKKYSNHFYWRSFQFFYRRFLDIRQSYIPLGIFVGTLAAIVKNKRTNARRTERGLSNDVNYFVLDLKKIWFDLKINIGLNEGLTPLKQRRKLQLHYCTSSWILKKICFDLKMNLIFPFFTRKTEVIPRKTKNHFNFSISYPKNRSYSTTKKILI